MVQCAYSELSILVTLGLANLKLVIEFRIPNPPALATYPSPLVTNFHWFQIATFVPPKHFIVIFLIVCANLNIILTKYLSFTRILLQYAVLLCTLVHCNCCCLPCAITCSSFALIWESAQMSLNLSPRKKYVLFFKYYAESNTHISTKLKLCDAQSDSCIFPLPTGWP